MEKFKKDPFKRGVMRFEDYNYNMYNKYILVEAVKTTKDSNRRLLAAHLNDTGLLTQQNLEYKL